MIGQMVSHYKIVEKLGEGGMGVVYKAEDTRLGRIVALKFLNTRAIGTEEDKTRFFREAQATASLQHPNICTVYEIAEHEGQPFIAMAFISGVMLSQKISAGPMDLLQAIDVAMQVAEGLSESHERGIIHRDIKGQNVMVDEKGRVTIMDFGLARSSEATQVTREGFMVGTVGYMSPEQTRGETVDHRVDIWALGILLYEMVAGRMPFRGDNDSTIFNAIGTMDPEPLTAIRTGVPMRLEMIVAKLLSKNPAERYQRLDDVLIDLRTVRKELDPESSSSRVSYASHVQPAAASTKRFDRGNIITALAIYSVIVVAAFFGARWIVDHYPLSPHLPTLTLAVLGALLPSVFLLAIPRQRRGRLAAIGVPINVVLAIVLVLVLFQGKDIGAATQTLTITDDDGNTVERIVPKSEFRKRVALYFFENETGDPEYDWIQMAIPSLVWNDLVQDVYLTVGSPWGYVDDFKDRGNDVGGIGASLTLKQKIASDSRKESFVYGAFAFDGREYTVTTTTNDTESGRVIAEHVYTSASFTDIVDHMSVDIKRDLGVPTYHLEATLDLPVAERQTKSMDALRLYILGTMEFFFSNDYDTAAKYLDKAVEEDPTYASAHWNRYWAHSNLNNAEIAEQALRNAMKHKYKLQERQRFRLMDTYYRHFEQYEQAFQNAQRWVELYPDATLGYTALANYHEHRGEYDDAVAMRHTILDIDPQQLAELSNIANLYLQKGDFDKASEFMQMYAEAFPDDYETFTELGDLFVANGQFEEARDNYARANLLEPEEVSVMLKLGGVELSLGHFDDVLRRYDKALRVSSTVEDSASVYMSKFAYHLLRAEGDASLQSFDRWLGAAASYVPPLVITQVQLFSLGRYVVAGQEELAWSELEAMEQQELVPTMRSLIPVGRLLVYSQIADPANAEMYEKELNEFAAFVEQSGMGSLDWAVAICRGALHSWRDEHEAALASYLEGLKTAPLNEPQYRVSLMTLAAMAYRELEQLDESMAMAEQALQLLPIAPQAHYQLGLTYYELGDIERALEHLNTTLRVWENGNPDYREVKEARDTFAEWRAQGTQ